MPSHPAQLYIMFSRHEWRLASTTIAARPRSARCWLRSTGLLDHLLTIIKNGLISSMYATAQKCRHINGILEKLFVGKKFSRQYMLL
jgi:hypothetical protein